MAAITSINIGPKSRASVRGFVDYSFLHSWETEFMEDLVWEAHLQGCVVSLTPSARSTITRRLICQILHLDLPTTPYSSCEIKSSVMVFINKLIYLKLVIFSEAAQQK